jgi:adhesin/invasin
MQNKTTRIPEPGNYSPAPSRFRPGFLQVLLTAWAWLMLGFSPHSMAAGNTYPGAAWGGTLGSMATYNVSMVYIFNNAIAGSGVNDIVEIKVTDAVTGLPVSGIQLTFTIEGSSLSSNPTTGPTGTIDYGLASGFVVSSHIKIDVAGIPYPDAIFNFVAGPPSVTPPPGSPNPTYYITKTNNATANGIAQNMVEVHLADQFGNDQPVGTLITFTILSSTPASASALLNGTTTTTIKLPLGPNGIVDMPITDMIAGPVTIQAATTIAGVSTAIGTAQVVTFVPDAPVVNPPPGSPNPSYYKITKNNATTGVTDQDIVEVHLTDGTNDEPAGTMITFTVTSATPASGAALLNGTTTTTITVPLGANGTVDLPITDKIAGDVTISATTLIGGVATQIGTAQKVTFVPDAPVVTPPPGSPNPSSYTTTKNNATANGSDQNIVEVHLTDGTNNEPAGTMITFTITSSTPASGTALLNGTTITTIAVPLGANGTVDLPITDKIAGDVTITAATPISGVLTTIGAAQKVTFVPDAPVVNPPPGSPNPSYYKITKNNATTGVTDQDIVEVHLTDGTNNEPAGTMVTFTITSSTPASGTALLNGTTTTTITVPLGANGTVDLPITDKIAGDVTINASTIIGGIATTIGTDQKVTFIVAPPVVTPPPGSPNPSYYKITKNNAVVGGTDQDIVEVHLTDGTNDEPAGTMVTFTITSSTPASGTALLNGTTTTTITVPLGANGTVDLPITDKIAGDVTINASTIISGITTTIGTDQKVTFIVAPPVVTPPPGSPNPSYYTITKNNATTGVTDQDIVEVHLTDGTNDEPAGTMVTFTITSSTPASGTALLNGTTTTTITVPLGANGTVDLPITDKIAGDVTINASTIIGGIATTIGTDQKVTFVAAPPVVTPPPGSPNPSYYKITKNNATTGVTDQDIVEVHLTDGTNDEPAGTMVTFTITSSTPASGTALLNGTTTTTITVPLGANGTVDLPITDKIAGDVTINASTIIGGIATTIGTDQKVTFIVAPPVVTPPPGSPNPSYYKITKNNATTGVTDQDIVEVHLTDGTNDEPAGTMVTFTITSSTPASGTALLNGTTTTTVTVPLGANGTVDLPITDKIAGDVTINASTIIGGIATTIGTDQKVTFVAAPPVVTPPPGSPNPSYYKITKNNATIGSTDQDIVEVHLTDGTNDEPAGTMVTFTITSSTPASGTALLNGTTTTTITVPLGANGTVDLPVTDVNSGDVTINASTIIGGVATTIGTDQKVTFVNNTADPNSGSYYKIIQNNAIADGGAQNVVEVHLTDDKGGPVAADIQVTFTVTSTTPASGNAKLGGTTITTVKVPIGTSNTYDLPVTDVTAGNVTITATILVGGVPTPIAGSPQTITFIAGPPSSTAPDAPSGTGTLLSITKDHATADAVDYDVVQAYITDDHGNAVGANVPVTLTLITGGSIDPGTGLFQAGSVTTINVLTNSSSIATANIISPRSGTLWVNGSIAPGTTISGSHQVANFDPGPPVPYAPGAPGGVGTLLTITTNNAPSDGSKTDIADAYITDKNGNLVPGVPVTFTFHTGGPANAGALFQPDKVTTITINTDATGHAVVPISNTVAGDAWIDAAINSGSIIDGSYATAHFTEYPDVTNPETALTVITYEALADGTSQTVVKAHVVDKDGNQLEGWDVTFHLDSGSATIITPQPVTTDANGDAFINITSKTPGYAAITATVDDKQITFGSPARVKFAAINIYVPKVFTPNNDGTNDILKPILVGMSAFHYFSVYNRWGNLIYTTEDPNRGWDGTFKGVAQPVETYLWIAEGVDTNGRKVVQKGMVSLVR